MKKVVINNYRWYLSGDCLYENFDKTGGSIHINYLTNQEKTFIENLKYES